MSELYENSNEEGHGYLFLIGTSSNDFELTSVIALVVRRQWCTVTQKTLDGDGGCERNNGRKYVFFH